MRGCPTLASARVTLFEGSQSDESVLEELIARTGPLDVVIDDGSHRWADQIAAFKKLYPYLRPGGYYVIEDLHTSYWEQYRSGPQSTVDFLRDLVDELNVHGRSGYGMMKNDPDHEALERNLNVHQRTIDSISFYKSLAVVRKKESGESES
jgi:hypothetical protein